MNRKPEHPSFYTWQYFSGCIYHPGRTKVDNKLNPLGRDEDFLSMLI